MNNLRTWFIAHPVLAFILVAYGFSWGLWALMIAVWGQINWLGSFGPSLAAIVVTAVAQGRLGVGRLLRPVLQWRFGPIWYLLILPGCVLLFLVALWAYGLLRGPVSLPGDQLSALLPQMPLYFLIVLFIGGPLGEEIGWRGFLLPHYLKQRSPLWSSLLVAAIWFCWHLPLFWLPGARQAGTSVWAFLLFIIVWTVLFTWVYLGTAGSLLAALLLHTTINTFSVFIGGFDPAYSSAPMLVYAGVAGLAALIVLALDRRMRSAATA